MAIFYDGNSVELNTFFSSNLPETSLRFPKNLADQEIPYVLFSPYKRSRTTSLDTVSGRSLLPFLPIPSWTIALPIPSSALSTNYSVTYETPSLGGVSGNILSGIQNMFTTAGGAPTAQSIKDVLVQGLPSIATGVASKLLTDAATGIASKVLDASRESIAFSLGQVENPFTEMLFQKVSFRNHKFTYKFYPKNADESKVIDQIIERFKFYMHPSYATTGPTGVGDPMTDTLRSYGTWLRFPYEWQIYLSIQDTTFSILPSVLDLLEVDYATGVDTPKLFAPHEDGKRYPTAISLSMQFTETFILTRNLLNPIVESTPENTGSIDAGRMGLIDVQTTSADTSERA